MDVGNARELKFDLFVGAVPTFIRKKVEGQTRKLDETKIMAEFALLTPPPSSSSWKTSIELKKQRNEKHNCDV